MNTSFSVLLHSKNVVEYLSRIDFVSLFFYVFVFSALFDAAQIAFNILAERKRNFSFLTIIVNFLGALLAFAAAYAEYETVGKTFVHPLVALLYAEVELFAITCLYAAFLSFASVKREKNKSKISELQTEKASSENGAADTGAAVTRNNDSRAVYNVVMKKGDAESRYNVDFKGVYEFLDGINSSSDAADEAQKLKSKIAFYEGLEMTPGVIKTVNMLFARAIRLAREE